MFPAKSLFRPIAVGVGGSRNVAADDIATSRHIQWRQVGGAISIRLFVRLAGIIINPLDYDDADDDDDDRNELLCFLLDLELLAMIEIR